MTQDGAAPALGPIRNDTLISLRWLALGGQLAAVAGALIVGARLPVAPLLAVLAFAAGLNLAVQRSRPVWLMRTRAFGQLSFDAVQVALVLILTGGLDNPFALFVLVPMILAATALDGRTTALMAALTVALIVTMTLLRAPLEFRPDAPLPPGQAWQLARALSLVIGGGFLTLSVHRIARELAAARGAMGAMGMALAREQRIQHVGGVVAAAAHELGTPLATIKLISSELADELAAEAAARPALDDDLRQLAASADRCRDILRQMREAGRDEAVATSAPLDEILAEAAAPHVDRGIRVTIDTGPLAALQVRREAELVFGLRNLIQNAVDFAREEVRITADAWDGAIRVTVRDDGPGYPPHLLGRLGEPFLTTRRGGAVEGEAYDGMGLGLFIARTLLERRSGQVVHSNDHGAVATVTWPRGRIEADAIAGLNPSV